MKQILKSLVKNILEVPDNPPVADSWFLPLIYNESILLPVAKAGNKED